MIPAPFFSCKGLRLSAPPILDAKKFGNPAERGRRSVVD
jgi:hypothetical protein